MSTIAIEKLKEALTEAEAELDHVDSSTRDVIEEGRRAQARLTAAEHAVSNIRASIATLESHHEEGQRGVVVRDA